MSKGDTKPSGKRGIFIVLFGLIFILATTNVVNLLLLQKNADNMQVLENTWLLFQEQEKSILSQLEQKIIGVDRAVKKNIQELTTKTQAPQLQSIDRYAEVRYLIELADFQLNHLYSQEAANQALKLAILKLKLTKLPANDALVLLLEDNRKTIATMNLTAADTIWKTIDSLQGKIPTLVQVKMPIDDKFVTEQSLFRKSWQELKDLIKISHTPNGIDITWQLNNVLESIRLSAIVHDQSRYHQGINRMKNILKQHTGSADQNVQAIIDDLTTLSHLSVQQEFTLLQEARLLLQSYSHQNSHQI